MFVMDIGKVENSKWKLSSGKIFCKLWFKKNVVCREVVLDNRKTSQQIMILHTNYVIVHEQKNTLSTNFLMRCMHHVRKIKNKLHHYM